MTIKLCDNKKAHPKKWAFYTLFNYGKQAEQQKAGGGPPLYK